LQSFKASQATSPQDAVLGAVRDSGPLACLSPSSVLQVPLALSQLSLT
jgi:hypothetical protein